MRTLQLVFFSILIGCRSTAALESYSPTDILLTIDDTTVTADEFLYSFKKSHQNEENISQSSVNDYLRLFTNYKLKVLEARNAGYDTAAGYAKELEGYQEQVKSSYRTSGRIMETLKEQAYERMKQEVRASHILLRLPEDASPADTLEVYKKIIEIREKAGEMDFTELVITYSEDPSARMNKGDLGYFSAFRMVYPFENAAYDTEVGEVSQPIRTDYGYHILKVHDKRPALYKLKLYQVQVMPESGEKSSSLTDKVFEIHEMLLNGLKPEQITETTDKEKFLIQHGSLPALAAIRMPRPVQQAARQLSAPGDISDPVESEYGWHIFILEEKLTLPPYHEISGELERMVRRSGRLSAYEDQLMAQLFKKYNVVVHVNPENIFSVLNDNDEGMILFTLNEKSYRVSGFKSYLNAENIPGEDEKVVTNAYSAFIEEQVVDAEDQEIVSGNRELRWLLKEYEEGMLLFNIMEDSVWNAATNDKEGLEKFNAANHKTMSAGDSTLNQGNGRAVVGYQQYLEEQWIKRLRTRHSVKVDRQVFERVSKKILQDRE